MRRFFLIAATFLLVCSCVEEKFRTDGDAASTEGLTLLDSKLIRNEGRQIDASILLVKLDSGSAAETRTTGSLAGAEGIRGIRPAVTYANQEVAHKYGLDRWFAVELEEGTTPQEMASQLAQRPEVKTIQYNTYLPEQESCNEIPYNMAETSAAASGTSAAKDGASTTKAVMAGTFNDPLLKDQWNLINTGDKTVAMTAMAGADISVKEAWNLCAGNPDIIVAVIDGAIKNIHPDLKNSVWRNEAEIEGQYGVDDDGNGYIDDQYGFNFVQSRELTLADGSKAWKGGALNWSDGNGHGTHVAGIIGAENNNGEGVSSIAGGTGHGDGVRLMSCQIFQGYNTTSDAQCAQAFFYAADNGASIANCSFGTPGGKILSDDIYINGQKKENGATEDIDGSPLEYAAMQYFCDPKNANCPAVGGNLIICSAGNEGQPYASYPAALPFCIAVTGFGPDYLPGGYSNYGPGCDIAAPGGDFSIGLPTYEKNRSQILSTGVSECTQENGLFGNRYTYMQGTSMAAPHVAGVAALGMAYAMKLGKNFTREEFIAKLLTSVNDINKLLQSGQKPYVVKGTTTMIPLNRYRGKIGTGAVDAWKFLMNIEGTSSIVVKKDEQVSVDLNRHFFDGADKISTSVTIDESSATTLGIDRSKLKIANGKLTFTCTQIGSGKITLHASIPGDTKRPDGIHGQDFTCDLAIACRPFVATNGGWF